MKKVMAFGSFSMIHPGHIDYLEEAKKLGDFLIVVINTDKNYEKEKKKRPVFNQKERKRLVSSLRVADEVVLGHENDFFRVIKEKKPNIIALGYDSRCKPEELQKNLAKCSIKTVVKRMHQRTKHQTRDIIKKIKKNH